MIKYFILGVLVLGLLIIFKIYFKGNTVITERTSHNMLEKLLKEQNFDAIDYVLDNQDSSIPILLSYSKNEDYRIRQLVIECVGQISDSSALQIIKNGLYDDNINVRLASINQVINLPRKEVGDDLIRLLSSSNDEVFLELVALASGKVLDTSNLGDLKLLSQKSDGKVKENLIMAMAKLGDKKSIQLILSELNDIAPGVRYEAIAKLEYIDNIGYIKDILPLLDDKSSAVMIGSIRNSHYRRVCDKAADALIKLGNPEIYFETGAEIIYTDDQLDQLKTL